MQMYISMHFLTLYVTLKTSKYIRNIIFKKFFQSKKCKNSSEKCEEDFIISLFSRPLVWFWPRPYGLKGVWMMPFFRMGTRGLAGGLTASMASWCAGVISFSLRRWFTNQFVNISRRTSVALEQNFYNLFFFLSEYQPPSGTTPNPAKICFNMQLK